MVEKRSKIVTKNDSYTYTINRYVDVNKEYDNISGAKKSAILAEYSEAKQRNIIMNALIKISTDLGVSGIEIDELTKMKSFIDSI